jgi:hypothetical protein
VARIQAASASSKSIAKKVALFIKTDVMKRISAALAALIFMAGCANNSGEVGRSDTDADTTKNVTTNSGAAGTGGVGAGFGTGGSAGTDTNTTPGVADTAR